jgi:ribosome recycling factor
MVALRAVRHEAMDAFDEAKKNKVLGEDEAKRLSGQVEDAMNKARVETETAAKAKETEIMTV